MAVLGFCEPNCDWLRILTSRKSFSGSSSQTLVFGGDKRQPEIRLRSQARVVVKGKFYNKLLQESRGRERDFFSSETNR